MTSPSESPDRRLLNEPQWRPEDLGAPLPDSPHANSVCLPEWRDIIDYEEKNPRVISRLKAGYPRFVVPALCARFFEVCRARFAGEGEACHAYPSERSARRAAQFIERWSGVPASVHPWREQRVTVVCFPEAAQPWALKYWRHTGEGISSRRADCLLSGRSEAPSAEARRAVVSRIARLAGASPDEVYLFKSGMAAIYALHRAAGRRTPDGACVQFGFPYVDTLKIQQDFGVRSAFFPLGSPHDLKMVQRLSTIDRIAGIFCEFPSNPLLNCPDIAALSRYARQQRFPLIVDDTISTPFNVNLLGSVDILVSSLTKYFTGRGDVMGGAVVLNPNSPLLPELQGALREEYEDAIWGDDLVLLEEYSRDFEARMEMINRSTQIICDWLSKRPDVEHVYYPPYQSRELYDAYRRPDGGYSGLFSLLLKNAPETTEGFYNRLKISKGPNLGTTFSLCCPFAMLAHYEELDWAERCGVSRYLLRFSIGLEPPEDLIARLDAAFASDVRPD